MSPFARIMRVKGFFNRTGFFIMIELWAALRRSDPQILLLQIHYSVQSRYVTVHSVHSNVAKIHSRLPAAMELWLVCLGIVVCE